MDPWIIDTFAGDEYMGNPAAVVPLPSFPPDERLQEIAREIGQPTTAFVISGADLMFTIRWFTPSKEIDLCGHGTVAAAGYLYDVEGVDPAARLCFATGAGPLYAQRVGANVAVDMPRSDPVACGLPSGMERAIGTHVVSCSVAQNDLVLELGSELEVANVRPRFSDLAASPYRVHIVTAPATAPGVDFVSRTFMPSLGLDEDQVCVSAHCSLAPYWAARTARTRLSALQLSPRGGRLTVELLDGRVRISGTTSPRSDRRDPAQRAWPEAGP